MSDILPYILSSFIGIGLAAASGFRVFLPLFAVSLASYLGWIPTNDNFQWLSGLPTLIITGVATLVEILAYYIPVVDNFLVVNCFHFSVSLGYKTTSKLNPLFFRGFVLFLEFKI